MTILVINSGYNGRPSMRSVYRRLRGGVLIESRPNLGMYINNNGYRGQRLPFNQDYFRDKKILNFNWGCSPVITSNTNYAKELNKWNGIVNASNKGVARRIMYSAGVSVPNPIDRTNYRNSNIKYPLIWRPAFHNKGKNFIVLDTWQKADIHMTEGLGGYYSEFIDKDREFRVHVAEHHGVIAMLEKPRPRNGGMKWNEDSANKFVNMYDKMSWPEPVQEEAIKAVKALELSTGGVDVILKGDKAYVLEINTAPTLYGNDYEINAYVKVLQNIIDNIE